MNREFLSAKSKEAISAFERPLLWGSAILLVGLALGGFSWIVVHPNENLEAIDYQRWLEEHWSHSSGLIFGMLSSHGQVVVYDKLLFVCSAWYRWWIAFALLGLSYRWITYRIRAFAEFPLSQTEDMKLRLNDRYFDLASSCPKLLPSRDQNGSIFWVLISRVNLKLIWARSWNLTNLLLLNFLFTQSKSPRSDNISELSWLIDLATLNTKGARNEMQKRIGSDWTDAIARIGRRERAALPLLMAIEQLLSQGINVKSVVDAKLKSYLRSVSGSFYGFQVHEIEKALDSRSETVRDSPQELEVLSWALELGRDPNDKSRIDLKRKLMTQELMTLFSRKLVNEISVLDGKLHDQVFLHRELIFIPVKVLILFLSENISGFDSIGLLDHTSEVLGLDTYGESRTENNSTNDLDSEISEKSRNITRDRQALLSRKLRMPFATVKDLDQYYSLLNVFGWFENVSHQDWGDSSSVLPGEYLMLERKVDGVRELRKAHLVLGDKPIRDRLGSFWSNNISRVDELDFTRVSLTLECKPVARGDSVGE